MRSQSVRQNNTTRLLLPALLVLVMALGVYNLLDIQGDPPLNSGPRQAQLPLATHTAAIPARTGIAHVPPASPTARSARSARSAAPYVKGEPPPYIPTLVPESSSGGLIDPPAPGPDDVQVHFINVGQGDSILILAPGGTAALIDGGYEGMGLVEYLQAHGVKRITLMVATHPHADHIGGLVDVLHAMPVDEVVTNGSSYTTQVYERFLDAIALSKAKYTEVTRRDTLQLGELRFDVLRPAGGATYSDINQSSIVLHLVYGSTSFLFTGDAGGQAEQEMLSSGDSLTSTILKVGHHGSHTSSSTTFLRAVHPEVAIYSAGKDNPYGHPHASVIENLRRAGAAVYGIAPCIG